MCFLYNKSYWFKQACIFIVILLGMLILFGCSKNSSSTGERKPPSQSEVSKSSPSEVSTRSQPVSPSSFGFAGWPLVIHSSMPNSEPCKPYFAHVLRQEMVLGFGTPLCADYLPNRAILAVGTDQGEILLVEANTGCFLKVFQLHQSPIVSIKFFPDGERLLTIDNNKTCIWNIKTGELVKTFTVSAGIFITADIAENSNIIAIAASYEIYLIDSFSLNVVSHLVFSARSISGIKLSSDGQFLGILLAAPIEVLICEVKDPATPKPLASFAGDPNLLYSYQDGIPNPIIKSVEISWLQKRYTIPRIYLPGTPCYSKLQMALDFFHNEPSLIFGYYISTTSSAVFLIINLTDFSWNIIETDIIPSVISLHFNNNYFIFAGEIKTVYHFNIESRRVIAVGRLEDNKLQLENLQSWEFGDPRDILTCFWIDEADYLFFSASRKAYITGTLGKNETKEITLDFVCKKWSMSRDGKYVVTMGDDSVTVWDVSTRRPLWTLKSKSAFGITLSPVYTVAPIFTADDKNIIIWNNNTPQGILVVNSVTGTLVNYIKWDKTKPSCWTAGKQPEEIWLGAGTSLFLVNIINGQITGTITLGSIPMEKMTCIHVIDENIYVGGAPPTICKIDRDKRTVVWTISQQVPRNAFIQRIAISGDEVIAVQAETFGPSCVRLLKGHDKASDCVTELTANYEGKPLRLNDLVDYVPIQGGTLSLVMCSGGVALLDPKTNQTLWAYPTPERKVTGVWVPYATAPQSITEYFEFPRSGWSALVVNEPAQMFGFLNKYRVFLERLPSTGETF